MSKPTVDSGLSLTLVDESTSKNSKVWNSILNFLTRLLIVFGLSAGGIFTFSSMMNFKHIEWISFVIILIASVVFSVVYKITKKHYITLIISVGIVLVAGLFMLDPVITGFKALYDSGVESACQAMYWSLPDKLVPWDDSYIVNTTYCMSMISVFITSLVSFFVVGRTQFIGAFLSTFPLFCIGATFACASDRLPFSALMSGWAAMLVLHISNRQKNIVRNKNADKSKTNRKFVYESKTSRFGGSALVMAVAIFLIFTLTTNILVGSGYSKSDEVDALRKNIKRSALNIYDLITGVDHDASLKEGDLTALGDRKPQDRHYLTIEMPNTKETIYLRGYVGSVYEGDKWTEFDKGTYKALDGIHKYLDDMDIYLSTLTGDLIYTNYEERNVKLAEFKIDELRREKEYIYSPNGVVSSFTISGYQDSLAIPGYTDEYSYRTYYRLSDYMGIVYTAEYQSESFKKQWQQYREFVYNNYTLLPEGIEEIAKLSAELQGDTVYKTIDNVRTFLTENTEFSNSAKSITQGEDFAMEFLFESGKGYSPHFATSAAVMLRALGVPTRYVEGYRISDVEIEKAAGNDEYKTLELTDRNHHAWLEFFDDSYGWIPVEVTNGFYADSFEALMQTNQDKAQKELGNKQEEEKEPEKQQPIDEGESEVVVEVEQEDEIVEDETEEQEVNVILIILIVLGVLLLLVVLGVIILFVRRANILSKRRAIFEGTDYRAQVVLAFELIIKILKFMGAEVEKTFSYEEFKQLAKSNFEDLNEEEFDVDKIFEIYEKAMFSKILITQEDADLSLDFYDEFTYSSVLKLTVAKRLKWMFIDVLS